MAVIARHNPLCLDEASLPRCLATRGALLAFLAGALFVIGLIVSQPAHAAVTDAPGTTGAAGAVAGVTGAAGTAAGMGIQAGAAAIQAAGQAAGQVTGLATSAAQAAASAAGQAAGPAGQAVSTVTTTAGQTVGGAVSAAGQAVSAATRAVGGAVTGTAGDIPGGTGPGDGTRPPHRHHTGRSPHRHHRGHPRRHHGTPGGHPGRPGHPAPGPAGRLVAVAANLQNPGAARTPAHGRTAGLGGGRDHPASPSPVFPAFPVPPATGSSGPGAGAFAGHEAAGLPALTGTAAEAAASIPPGRRADWTALLRDRRGPHRPG